MNGMQQAPIIGINWGSSNFRAFLIHADGRVADTVEQPRGIVGLDRAQMEALLVQTAARWPDAAQVYACGMVGSNVGWSDAGYADCPATPQRLAARLHRTHIGPVEVAIVPGLACRRPQDDAPDIMRGEETELLGLLDAGQLPLDGLVALPGTHSKWVQLQGGAVASFLTAMSGEVFDRLTAAGLLASVVDGPAEDGPAFLDGLLQGHRSGLGLGSLLFGARARVIRGELPRRDGASWLRGVLIGADRRIDQITAAGGCSAGVCPVCARHRSAGWTGAFDRIARRGNPRISRPASGGIGATRMNHSSAAAFDAAIEHTPLVAILRGLTGAEALAVGQALVDAGVRLAEVPLNSPDPLATIALMAAHFGDRLLVGAGTVLEVEQVQALAAIGCRFCVSP
ncbi:MAG: hypothetical protein DI589_27005, partial [Shinella sp.]